MRRAPVKGASKSKGKAKGSVLRWHGKGWWIDDTLRNKHIIPRIYIYISISIKLYIYIYLYISISIKIYLYKYISIYPFFNLFHLSHSHDTCPWFVGNKLTFLHNIFIVVGFVPGIIRYYEYKPTDSADTSWPGRKRALGAQRCRLVLMWNLMKSQKMFTHSRIDMTAHFSCCQVVSNSCCSWNKHI